MSSAKSQIQGRAIFGTVNGLVAEGDGLLSGVGNAVSVFEFDIGRQRDGILHKLEPDDPALFFRRILDKNGSELDLVGLVSPCVDAHGRRGFMGACVALQPDILRPTPKLNSWPELYNELVALFKNVVSFYDHKSGKLRWRPTLQETEADYAFGWTTAEGENAYLHDEPNESDSRGVFESMQAMAFVHGSKYTTMLVFPDPMEGTTSISDPAVTKAVEKLKSMRHQAEANNAQTPSYKEADAHQSMQSARAGSSANLTEMQEVWQEIDKLRDELEAIKASVRGGPRLDNSFEQSLQKSVFTGNTDENSKNRLRIFGAIIVAVTLLVAIIAVVLFFYFG